jgi:hypothetical protein
MDITNNLNNPILSGGATDNFNLDHSDSDINSSNSSNSSNFDVSFSDSLNNVLFGGSKNISEDDINNVLLGNNIIHSINNFTIDDLNKFKLFNNLDSDLKVKVFNKLLEFTNKKTSHIVHDNDNVAVKNSYFYCKACGYFEIIPPKTLLFSRYIHKKNTINNNFNILKFDHTLPSTKKYVCINPSCITHSQPSSKSAVFFRIPNSYNTKYICTVCDFNWLTYSNI